MMTLAQRVLPAEVSCWMGPHESWAMRHVCCGEHLEGQGTSGRLWVPAIVTCPLKSVGTIVAGDGRLNELIKSSD